MNTASVAQSSKSSSAPSALRRYGVLTLKTVFFTYFLCLVGVYSVQGYALYPGRLISKFAPSVLPRYSPTDGVEAVTLRTADGETLFGYLKKPRPGAGLLVSFHGNGGFPEHHVLRFETGPWQDQGWGFLVVTYRGFYRATGVPTEETVLSDAEMILRYAAERVPDARILMHGHSLGAAVAVATAAKHPGMGVFLEAPFLSMSAMARHKFPIFPTDALLHDTYRSDLRISSVTGPIVIAHGRDDDLVPFSSGAALAAVAGDRAKFIPMQGDHLSIFGLHDREIEPMLRSAPMQPVGLRD